VKNVVSREQFLAFQEGLFSLDLKERTETARTVAYREIVAGRGITYQACTRWFKYDRDKL
jgi:hypothetical protein